MKLYVPAVCDIKRCSNVPTHHISYQIFISIAAIRENIKRSRACWRKLIKAARHKSSQEFVKVLNALRYKKLLCQVLLEQTYDGWNLFSKVARWQKKEGFLKVLEVCKQIDKKIFACVLQQRNKNGASAFDLAMRYQSSVSFGIFLQQIKEKNLKYCLLSHGRKDVNVLLNSLLTYQSSQNIKVFIEIMGREGLSQAIRQRNHNLDNVFGLFFSGDRPSSQIKCMLEIIHRTDYGKGYQRAMMKALSRPNKQGWSALHYAACCQSSKLFKDIISCFDIKTFRLALGRRTKSGENLLNLAISSEQAIEKLQAIYEKLSLTWVNKMLLRKNRKGWSPFMQVLREEKPQLIQYILQKINDLTKLSNLIHEKKLTVYEQEWLAKMLVRQVARDIFSSLEPKSINKKVKNIVVEYKSTFIREIVDILKAKHDGARYMRRIKSKLTNGQKLRSPSNKEDKRIQVILELIQAPQVKIKNHFRPVFFKRNKKKRKNPFVCAIKEINLVSKSLDRYDADHMPERSLTPKIFRFVA